MLVADVFAVPVSVVVRVDVALDVAVALTVVVAVDVAVELTVVDAKHCVKPARHRRVWAAIEVGLVMDML